MRALSQVFRKQSRHGQVCLLNSLNGQSIANLATSSSLCLPHLQRVCFSPCLYQPRPKLGPTPEQATSFELPRHLLNEFNLTIEYSEWTPRWPKMGVQSKQTTKPPVRETADFSLVGEKQGIPCPKNARDVLTEFPLPDPLLRTDQCKRARKCSPAQRWHDAFQSWLLQPQNSIAFAR